MASAATPATMHHPADDGRHRNVVGFLVIDFERANLCVLLGLGVSEALINESENAECDENNAC